MDKNNLSFISSFKHMKRFITKTVFLILLPVIVGVVVCEIFLRRIPNDYAYKNEWLTNSSDSVQILNLGSSHAFFGIEPSCFSHKAFNAAHVSQSIKYDHFIFNLFDEKLYSLKVLVLPISYFSMLSSGPENGIEDWRVKYYSIYYHCKYHKFEPKYNLEIYNGLHLKNVLYSMLGKTSHRTCSDLGYGTTYQLEYRAEDWKESGVIAAKRHTIKNIDTIILEKNKSLIEDMIAVCKKRHIQVIIVTTPTYQSYRDSLDKKQLDISVECCNEFAKHDNVCYLDLLDDKRFTEDDFFDADHLNEYGAAKLTGILQQTIDSLGIFLN